MQNMRKLDALIDQKGKVQDDIYRAEQAIQENGEMPGAHARPRSTDPQKLNILKDAKERLAMIDAQIKACLAADKP
ncbi:MAG: hypothetical protein NVSMB6_22380 [Burkholderiaceae bacterium]